MINIFTRYFICLDIDKEKLKKVQTIINKKLENDFKLRLNPKTHIGKLKDGLDFLGFRFILQNNKLYLKIRTMIKKRFKKKVKKLTKLSKNNHKYSKVLESVHASYYGHLKEGNTYYLYKKIVKKYHLKNYMSNI